MATTITVTYQSGSTTLQFSQSTIAPGDMVEVQGLGQGQSGTLSWNPNALFTDRGSSRGVQNGSKLTTNSNLAGTYKLSLTVGDNAPAVGYLQASPGSFQACYAVVYGPGGSQSSWLQVGPSCAIARAQDTLRITGLWPNETATLKWNVDFSLFNGITGNSTTVKNLDTLTVANGVVGGFTLTLEPASQPSATSMNLFFVNSTSINYTGTNSLQFIPSPYVNHDDAVFIWGVPPNTTAKLSWTDPTLFKNYLQGGLNVPVMNGNYCMVSSKAAMTQAPLNLSVTCDGDDEDTKMSSGTLCPTGD